MDWKTHFYRVGSHVWAGDTVPPDGPMLAQFISDARKLIEPWLSAVFQSEHFNLLIGSGFTTAVALTAGGGATGMGKVVFGSAYDAQMDTHAAASAKKMGRGSANIEDQFRSALAVYEGLLVTDSDAAKALKAKMDAQLLVFLKSLLESERQRGHLS